MLSLEEQLRRRGLEINTHLPHCHLLHPSVCSTPVLFFVAMIELLMLLEVWVFIVLQCAQFSVATECCPEWMKRSDIPPISILLAFLYTRLTSALNAYTGLDTSAASGPCGCGT